MNKILFVIDTLETGGAEKSILEIASRFKNYTPVICHVYAGETLKADYERAGIEVFSLQVPGRYNFGAAAGRLQQVIVSVKPVIIHSTLFRSDVICRRLRKKNGIPLVNSLVNNAYHGDRFKKAGLLMKFKLAILRLVDAYTASNVDLFISNSEAIKKSNAKALHIPQSKITVIYRGRSYQDFSSVDTDTVASLRQELGLQRGKIVLNISRLLERKGQLDLIRAFQTVLASTPDVVLLIAGEGAFRARLEEEIVRLNLQDKVKMPGTRSDVPVLLNAANIFVFPSHYEGLPGALIEAMMARTPIVASDIPENLECVQDHAFIYPSGNIAALADAILEALRKPGHAEMLAAKAYERAKTEFDIDAISTHYETLYDSMLKA